MQVGGSTSSFSLQWQVKSLQMQKETEKVQGAGMLKLIQQASPPQSAPQGQTHLGQHLDLRV